MAACLSPHRVFGSGVWCMAVYGGGFACRCRCGGGGGGSGGGDSGVWLTSCLVGCLGGGCGLGGGDCCGHFVIPLRWHLS